MFIFPEIIFIQLPIALFYDAAYYLEGMVCWNLTKNYDLSIVMVIMNKDKDFQVKSFSYNVLF